MCEAYIEGSLRYQILYYYNVGECGDDDDEKGKFFEVQPTRSIAKEGSDNMPSRPGSLMNSRT